MLIITFIASSALCIFLLGVLVMAHVITRRSRSVATESRQEGHTLRAPPDATE